MLLLKQKGAELPQGGSQAGSGRVAASSGLRELLEVMASREGSLCTQSEMPCDHAPFQAGCCHVRGHALLAIRGVVQGVAVVVPTPPAHCIAGSCTQPPLKKSP